MADDKTESVIIRKYANRRLYDTSRSAYVTLEDLCQLVKDDVTFTVVDARSGKDLTRIVLTQIIFEQESKGYNLLPTSFLRNIIGFYDDNLGALLPTYLEKSMDNFTKNQDKIRNYVDVFGGYSPLKNLEELGKQNIEIFEKTFGMFSPFGSNKEKDDE